MIDDVSTGVIINGKRELVPGLRVTNWIDNPVLRLRAGEDFKPRRTGWIRQVVLHTTKGIPGGSDQRKQVIRDGLGPSMNAGEACARWWSKSTDPAGAHLVVDHDGEIYCCVDLQTEAAMHARHANQTSIGVEIYQGRDAELYLGQLDVVVKLVDFLTRRFGIQRQIPHQYFGPLHRLMDEREIEDVVGVIGHRDLDKRRGLGDPGNKIFYMLGMAQYEPIDFDQRKDLEEWRKRQLKLGITPTDGIPGPATVAALAAAGRPHGLWVARPGDKTRERELTV